MDKIIELDNITQVFFDDVELNELHVHGEKVWELKAVGNSTEAYNETNLAKETLLFNGVTLTKIPVVYYDISGEHRVDIWQAEENGNYYFLGKYMDVWFHDPMYAARATRFDNGCYCYLDPLSLVLTRCDGVTKWLSHTVAWEVDQGTWGCRIENRIIYTYNKQVYKWRT